MLAIIAHPTEELNLIKLTKQLIAENYSNNLILYRKFPLWIQLSETLFCKKNLELLESKKKQEIKKVLKDLSNSINKVVIDSPILYPDGIFCPVSVVVDDKVISTELQLAEILSDSQNPDFPNHDKKNIRNISQSDLFPLELKIFRIGIIADISTNALALSDSVWRKL